MEIHLIIIFVFCSALFSGTEIAFISSNQLQIELGKKQGKYADSILSWFNKRKSTNVLFILLVQTFISSIIVLFFAEFLPKTIFRINPNRTLHFFLIPVVLFYFVLLLPALLISSLSEFIIKTFTKGQKEEAPSVLGRIDLNNYFEEMAIHQKDDVDVENEVQIFQNALDFSGTKAREIMVPRNEVVAMDIEDDISELKENFITSGLSKILIYREKIDNIIGYVHNKELFKNPSFQSRKRPTTY